MKKLLALVLALVMTLGLATVSSSAAYSDANDIEYTEAADVMTAVGVFQGKGDAFAPKDNLNRAEAAKLVAYLMLGNKTAEAMKGSGAKFTDVPADHWASGYIEYLATAGVVSGVGGGNFDPNGQVTAVQFAKMLLVALGYDAEIEGFTGNSSWAINIQKLANDNDLYDLLDDVTSTAALTREQAAQMCLNDLKADMVEYESKGTTVSVGDAKVTTDAKKASEKAEKGSNNYNNAAVNSSDRKFRQLAEELYGNDLKLTGTSDDLGRPANKWTYKSKDVGTYAAKSDCIYTTTSKVKVNALYDVVGKDAYENMVDGTDRLELFINGQSSATVINNGATEAARQTAVRNYFYKDSSADAANVGNGTLFEIYQTENYDGNNNDKYTIIAANTYLYQATADYSKTSESVKVAKVTDDGSAAPYAGMPTEIKQEDFAVSDIVKDDYLLVTYSQSAKEFQTVAKAEVVQGKITSYVSADSLTIDGTKHSYSATIGANSTHGKGVEFDVGAEAKVVLDANGNILFVDDADVSNTYVYIKSSGSNTLHTKLEAEAYFTDGTKKTITVKKASFYDGTAVTRETALQGNATTSIAAMNGVGFNTDYLQGQWYTYTVDSNGEYTLKVVGTDGAATPAYKNTDNKQAYVTINESGTLNQIGNVLKKENVSFIYATTVNANNNTTMATTGNKGNDETKVIVLDSDDDITVYTGTTNIPGIKFSSVAGGNNDARVSYVYDEDGYTKYVFVDVKDVKESIDDSTESKDYAFVLRPRTDKNYVTTSDYYYEYDLYRNGAVEKVVKVDEDAVNDMARGTLINKIKTNSKGYISGANAIDNAEMLANPTDYVVATGVNNNAGTNKITVNGNTITLNGSAYVLNTSEIVLVYDQKVTNKGNVASLLDDANANYEVNVVSGSTLDSNLKNYTYEYDFTAVLSDNSANKIDQLYVRIYNAKETGVVSVTPSAASETSTVADATNNQIVIPAIANTSTAQNAYTVNGGALSSAKVQSEVRAALAGYTDFDFTGYTFAGPAAGVFTDDTTVAKTGDKAVDQGTVTATNPNGVTEVWGIVIAPYYPITIDGTVVEYVAHDTNSTKVEPYINEVKTTGTGFIHEVQGTKTYVPYTTAAAATGQVIVGAGGYAAQNVAVTITTGYVAVNANAAPGFATYAKVGSAYTVPVLNAADGTHWFVEKDSDNTAISVVDATSSGLSIPAATFGENDIEITKVYKFTVDSTVFYAAPGADLDAVGSTSNILLTSTGSYIASTAYGLAGPLYPLIQNDDQYVKVTGTAYKDYIPVATTATVNTYNGGALNKDLVLETGYYQVNVSTAGAGGNTDTYAEVSTTINDSTNRITTTQIYLKADQTVAVTAVVNLTKGGGTSKGAKWTVDATGADDVTSATNCTKLIAGAADGQHEEAMSYQLKNPSAKNVTVVFTLTDLS